MLRKFSFLALAMLPFVMTNSHASFAQTATAEAIATQAPAEEPRNEPQPTPEPPLWIGSVAPNLTIEHWVQTGEGRFAPIQEFVPGQIYVVEFWATSCGPCVAIMPKVAGLQKKYADRGVTIISVSDEPLETITEFLKRKVTVGEETITYNDLTKGYCLTTDPDGSTYTDYMKAARETGIPCAFLVGKDGCIEWMGYAGAVGPPLEKVLNDSWDREAYVAELKADREYRRLKRETESLAAAGKIEEARAKLDEFIASCPYERLKKFANSFKSNNIEFPYFKYLLRNDHQTAAQKLVEMSQHDRVGAGMLLEDLVSQSDRGELSPELITAAIKVTEANVKTNPNDDDSIHIYPHAFFLYCHARLVYLQGDHDRAIELFKSASVANEADLKQGEGRVLDEAKRRKREIDAFLEQLTAEKEGTPTDEANEKPAE